MRWKRKSGGVYWWDMKSSGIVDGMWNRLLLVRGGVNRWCWRLMVGWRRGSWDLAELRELGMKGFGGFFIYFLFFNTKPIRFASSNQTESKLKIKFRFGSTQPECPPQLRRKSPLIIIFFSVMMLQLQSTYALHTHTLGWSQNSIKLNLCNKASV